MKDTINYMKSLGLTEYQARAMIVLFCKREATAKDVCTFGGVRQTKVYQVLKSLEDKGFVTYNYAKPREYHGMPPAKVMNKLIGKQEKAVKDLKDLQNEKMKELKSLSLEPATTDKRVHPMLDVGQYKRF
ncbi:MAG: helix-turn-helix domain-containing protein [archaeon]